MRHAVGEAFEFRRPFRHEFFKLSTTFFKGLTRFNDIANIAGNFGSADDIAVLVFDRTHDVAPTAGFFLVAKFLPALFSTSESISWKEAAASQDIAARVIPRIKDSAHADSQLPKGGLPNLLPLLDNE